MTAKLVRIEGANNLMKDMKSGAVINTDDNSYRQAKEAKRRFLESEEKQKNLEEKINILEQKLNSLLQDMQSREVYGSR